MTYLVTGGTGVIGSRVVRDLAREGGRVVAYDLSPDENMLAQVLNSEEGQRVKTVRGNVTDWPFLMQTAKENDIDTIYHLAAMLRLEADEHPRQAIEVNVLGTLNVFETARMLGLKKVIWSSSNTIFGAADKYPPGVIPNDSPHYPFAVYGATKSCNEWLAIHYYEAFGVDISAIRYCLVYGPGQTRGGSGALTSGLVTNPALGRPGVLNNGDELYGWCYVDDAARATVMIGKLPRSRMRAYSIQGELRTVKEAAGIVKRLIPGASITVNPGGRRMKMEIDETPIITEVGYRPQWSLERGLREMINLTRRQHGLPTIS